MKNKEKPAEKTRQNIHPAQPGIPTDSFIRWQIVRDTIQHPLNLTALVVCTISTTFLLFLSPVFGVKWEAFAVSLISGIIAAGSNLYRYYKEYPIRAREIMENLKQEMKQSNESELKRLYENLRAGFFSLASDKGLMSLVQLISEYEQLQTALSRQRATDPLSISLIPGLAEETCRRGLGVLSDALELMQIFQTPGRTSVRHKLEKEIARLGKDIQALKDNPDQVELINVKKESLIFCEKRLDMIYQLQLHIEQLLYHAQRCEAALQSTRVELAEVRAGSSKSSVDSVIEVLQERINQVKEVQDELKKMGY